MQSPLSYKPIKHKAVQGGLGKEIICQSKFISANAGRLTCQHTLPLSTSKGNLMSACSPADVSSENIDASYLRYVEEQVKNALYYKMTDAYKNGCFFTVYLLVKLINYD